MSKFEKMTAEATGLDASVNAVLQALREPETSGLNPAQFQAVFAEVVTAFAKYRESDKGGFGRALGRTSRKSSSNQNDRHGAGC